MSALKVSFKWSVGGGEAGGGGLFTGYPKVKLSSCKKKKSKETKLEVEKKSCLELKKTQPKQTKKRESKLESKFKES